MGLSNPLRKLWAAFCLAFGITVVLFSAYQLYSAIAEGTVQQFSRGHDGWVSYQTSPGWFVSSVIFYALALVLFAAAVIAVIFEQRAFGRWRRRQHLDTAIRQPPQER